MNLLLFDVCHTLYKSNTTFDFLAFYFGDDPQYQNLAKQRWSLRNRILSKLGFAKDLRTEMVALLAGESESRVRDQAAAFVAGLDEIEPTVSALQTALSADGEVALISGSLDVIVAAVAERLGVDQYFSSHLSFTNGVCDGTIVKDLEGNKAETIRHEYSDRDVTLITDNFSDANCITVVSEFRPVYPQGDVRAALFWFFKPTAKAIRYG